MPVEPRNAKIIKRIYYGKEGRKSTSIMFSSAGEHGLRNEYTAAGGYHSSLARQFIFILIRSIYYTEQPPFHIPMQTIGFAYREGGAECTEANGRCSKAIH